MTINVLGVGDCLYLVGATHSLQSKLLHCTRVDGVPARTRTAAVRGK